MKLPIKALKSYGTIKLALPVLLVLQCASPLAMAQTSPSTGTQTSAPAQQDTRATVNLDVAARAGQRSALKFAAAVVRAFGGIENIRYNFYLGFQDAKINIAAILGSNMESDDGTNAIDVTVLPDYRNNYNIRADQGRIDGAAAGVSRADQVATNQGSADAAVRFVQALNQPQKLNVQPPVLGAIQAPVMTPSLSAVPGVEDRLRDVDSAMLNQFVSEYATTDEIILGPDVIQRINISKLYEAQSFQDDLLASWNRGDNALSQWQQQTVTNAFQADVAYYNAISDSNTYQNADQAQQAFAQAFVNAYESVISTEWNAKVTHSDPEVRMYGERFFDTSLKAYAAEKAAQDGYIASYSSAAGRSYVAEYPSSYNKAFSQTVTAHKNGEFVDQVAVQAFTAASESQFGVGDQVVVYLLSGANTGEVGGVLPVQMQAGPAIQITSKNFSFNFAAMTSFHQRELVGSMGTITTAVNANDNISANISVGSINSTIQLPISWGKTLKNMARTSDYNQLNLILQYVRGQLKNEWDHNRRTFSNIYKSADHSSLIEQLVLTFQGMTPQEQAAIQRQGHQIASAIGARPSGFFSGGSKKDWDAAIADLAAIGIKP